MGGIVTDVQRVLEHNKPKYRSLCVREIKLNNTLISQTRFNRNEVKSQSCLELNLFYRDGRLSRFVRSKDKKSRPRSVLLVPTDFVQVTVCTLVQRHTFLNGPLDPVHASTRLGNTKRKSHVV